MPRGPKKSDDDLLMELDTKIVELKTRRDKIDEKIKTLQQKQQTILDGQKQKEASELLELLKTSGKSLEDIKSLLK